MCLDGSYCTITKNVSHQIFNLRFLFLKNNNRHAHKKNNKSIIFFFFTIETSIPFTIFQKKKLDPKNEFQFKRHST